MMINHRSIMAQVVFPLIMALVLLMLGCSDSSAPKDTTPNTLHVTHLSLPQQQTVLYEHHPFQFVLAIAGSSDISGGTSVTANLFLVDSQQQQEEESEQEMLGCWLGSTEIVLDEVGESKKVTGLASVSEGCLDTAIPHDKFSFAVLLTRNDTLLNKDQLNEDNYILLTEPMATSEVNQRCVGENEDSGCVVQVGLEASPGLEVEMLDLELDNSIVLNYARQLSDNSSHDEIHTPNLTATVDIRIDGISQHYDDALTNDDLVYISYSTRPAGASENWLKLTVQDFTSLTPDGHENLATISEAAGGASSQFSHPLFIEATLFEATGPGGMWEDIYHYDLRACVTTSFEEVDLQEQDEDANNCQIKPFFLSERLSYNPDITQEDTQEIALSSKSLSLNTNERASTSYVGLYKNSEWAFGDGDPLKLRLAMTNEARYGINGNYSLTDNLLIPGSGVPFAKMGNKLEASVEGLLNIELLLINFSHMVTHKEATETSDWLYDRRYKPRVQLSLFNVHFIDVLGSIALPSELEVVKGTLEKESSLFEEQDNDESTDGSSNELVYVHQFCDRNGVDALVVALTADLCITGTMGIDYGLTIFASDVDKETASNIGFDAWVDPFGELELAADTKINLALFEGKLTIAADLIKVHFAHDAYNEQEGKYIDGASLKLETRAIGESTIIGEINTQALLEESTLSGDITIDGLLTKSFKYERWFKLKPVKKKYKKTLFEWDGIDIAHQPLWDLSVSKAVQAESVDD